MKDHCIIHLWEELKVFHSLLVELEIQLALKNTHHSHSLVGDEVLDSRQNLHKVNNKTIEVQPKQAENDYLPIISIPTYRKAKAQVFLDQQETMPACYLV